jgi:hypothetical protein
LHFDHCGGSVQWNRKKQATNLLSKHKFWSNEATGNGQQTQSERLLLSEIFCRCKKAGNLILSKGEGDFLEQSELGFGIFFADGHTDKQMIPHIQYKGKTIVYGGFIAADISLFRT